MSKDKRMSENSADVIESLAAWLHRLTVTLPPKRWCNLSDIEEAPRLKKICFLALHN